MRKSTGIVFVAIGLILATYSVAAAPTGASTSTSNANATASTSGSDSVAIEAGAVSQVDVSSDSLTEKWSGFYGAISGNKILGDGSSNFYEWTSSDPTGAKVITVPTGNSAPSAINAVSNPNTFLGSGFNNADHSDTANKTFNRTEEVTFDGTATATAAIDTYNSTGQSDGNFTTFLAENSDDTGQPVYIAEGTGSETGFNGNTVDYQMLVGVGESASSKTFDFYLELS